MLLSASSAVKNQINSPAAHLLLSLVLFLLSALLSLINHLSSLLYLPLLAGAHCQGSIKPHPFRGCVLVRWRKKEEKKKPQQSQSRRASVVTRLPYRHNPACCLSTECPQTSSARFKRGGHPEKHTFNKDLPLPG